MSGVLECGGKPLKLYAMNLKYDPSGGASVVAVVLADGFERAFTFTGEIATTDGTVRFQPMTAPRVRVRVDECPTGTAPLPIRIETDNAPANATLDVQIGTLTLGSFTSDFTHPPLPAKARTVGVKFDPKGAVILKAAVNDLESKLPVDELVGVRYIEARLVDANGTELAPTFGG